MLIHYMLTQDAQSGLTIREAFAKTNTTGVKVGTFEGLLDLLMEYWLLSVPEVEEWKDRLAKEAARMTDAFWARSIQVDEKSVVEELAQTLRVLLEALPLENPVLEKKQEGGSRAVRYYNDLVELHTRMGNVLPSAMTKAKLWLAHKDLPPIDKIIVYASDMLHLEKWQRELLEALETLYSKEADRSFEVLYHVQFKADLSEHRDDTAYLQERLFGDAFPGDAPPIEHLQWLVARDALQEVEVLAGMIQNIVKTDTGFEDIAVVIPRDGWYQEFVTQTFSTFNIPLSRAGRTEAYADIGTLWIFDALQAQEEFAPPMVFASLLSSPLMPYGLREGQYFASVAMENGWRDDEGDLKKSIRTKLNDKSEPLVTTVISWQEDEKEKSIFSFLQTLAELESSFNTSEALRLHRQRYNETLTDLHTYLENFPEAKIADLLNQVRPYALQENAERIPYLHSVHLVFEDEWLLGEVEHLFVLGFNEGRYPRKLESAGVFSRIQWEELAGLSGLDLHPQEQFYTHAKKTFQRQLQCAKSSITFFASALDLQGERLSISSSLADMAYAFYHQEKELEPEKLLIYLEEENQIPFFFTTADSVSIDVHRSLLKEDLHFHQDLLALRTNKDGTRMPESPSSLEKLMVSPLAWFLYRRKLEPKTWSVQELDVATQGTIAHGVFEDIFSPKNPSYSLNTLSRIIEKRIEEYAPFLKQDHRRLEYEQLKKEIVQAAESFKMLLTQCQGTVVKTEEKLHGLFHGMPVSGRTDALLDITGRNLVLDYKKSGRSGRIKRMKNGFDHQLFLYRLMLADEEALSAYYTMNDATLIVDQPIACPDRNGLNIEEIESDCTVNAQRVLQERIEEITKGEIPLNLNTDEKRWSDRGITASYTLDISPLVRLFMKEEEADDAEN